MTQQATVPDRLRAVVIDTNGTPHGRVDINALGSLAEILGHKAPEAEIWIPEPVMWEWAAHAQEDYVELVKANNAAVRKLNSAGVRTSFAQVKDQDRTNVYGEVCRRVEMLPRPFRILRLSDHPRVAIEALRDQVTLEPPAKRKNGIKTGASDIASLQLARAHAAGDGDRAYVIVSDDVDVKKMADWGDTDVRLFSTVHSLSSALLHFQPIEIRRVADVYHRVAGWVERVRSGESGTPEIQAADVDRGLLYLDREDYYLRIDVEINQIHGVLALRGVDVDDVVGIGTATVYVRGDLTMTGWQLDQNGEQLVADTDVAYAAVIALSVTYQTEGAASDLAIESIAAHVPEQRFDDEDEALNYAVEFLADIPGFNSLLDSDGIPVLNVDGAGWSAEVNGKNVTIDVMTPVDPKNDFGWEWKLSVEVDNAGVEVACHFHDTWMGGSEGGYMEPPYVLGDNHADLYSVSEFLMSNLYADKIQTDGVGYRP